jgi:transcription termination factor NusB
MIYEKQTPAITINESVELTKKFCAEKSPSLVNALLDKIRQKEIATDEK